LYDNSEDEENDKPKKKGFQKKQKWQLRAEQEHYKAQ